MKKATKKTLGCVLILLGFAALVTPLTPGAGLMLFAGMELLGIHLIHVDKFRAWLKEKKDGFSKKEPRQ